MNMVNEKWDRIVATCPQCKIYLHWDVSVYEDSKHHVCSWCTNCSNKIEKGDQSAHFTFNSDNKPNFVCLKSDAKEACLGCDSVVLRKKGLCDCYVSDLGGSFFTFANICPNAKAHCVMSSKKHIKDVRFMNIDDFVSFIRHN